MLVFARRIEYAFDGRRSPIKKTAAKAVSASTGIRDTFMAKKKAANRSAKKAAPKKREIANNMPPPRPPFFDVPFYDEAGDQTAQQIAAHHAGLPAAVLASSGESVLVPPIPSAASAPRFDANELSPAMDVPGEPPGTAPVHVALEGRSSIGLRSGAGMGVQSDFSGAEIVIRASLPVVPAVYPESSNGTTVVCAEN
jgi:hypothetical protein